MGDSGSTLRPNLSTLPTPLTRFVGREAELARAIALLAEGRLLTLIGAGGAGKTRLALQLASVVENQFPDGAWFVDFSPLPDGQFVWDQLGTTLALRDPGPNKTWASTVSRFLAPRHVLLVFDNCEHLVESAALVTNALLTAAPGLNVIATSRVPLGVGGELTWAVPALNELDGVELFTDRAHYVRPDLSLHAEDVDAVREICRRLDGLPLAIELAAARTRALAPMQLVAHLSQRLSALPTGPRTAPPRQATLRASFEWSYELLTDKEQALLRQLSVFAGSFDLDAVLAVCPATSIELVATLADRSLITLDDRRAEGQARFRMLETIREFANEQLAASGEGDLMRARHHDHFLALAEQAEPMKMGADRKRWLARLSSDQDNLRAALAWSKDHRKAEHVARLVVALYWFWGNSRFGELRVWVEAASVHIAEATPLLRAKVRNLQCDMAIRGGSIGDVPALANEALALARASGDHEVEALALLALGFAAGIVSGADAMRPYMDEALPLARSTNPGELVAVCLSFFGLICLFKSDPEEPRRLLDEAIGLAKETDDTLLAFALAVAGLTALNQGRLADADDLLSQALAVGRPLEEGIALTLGLFGVAELRMRHGDLAEAHAIANESLANARRLGESRTFEVFSMSMLGWVQLAGGQTSQAMTVLQDAAKVARSSEVPALASLPLVVLAEAQLAQGALEVARASLEEASSLAASRAYTHILGRVGLARAKLRAQEDNLQGAETAVHEAISLSHEAGDQLGLVDAVELLAHLAAAQESPKEAVRLWAAAESVRTGLGYARLPSERDVHESAIAGARNALGPDGFTTSWAEGAKLSLDEAVAYAARGRGERKRPSSGWASLTPSELDVVRLVGEHLSNLEIASRLFVSRSTVKSHLLHIFSKLGIDSRSELAAEAIKRGIARRPEQPLRK